MVDDLELLLKGKGIVSEKEKSELTRISKSKTLLHGEVIR